MVIGPRGVLVVIGPGFRAPEWNVGGAGIRPMLCGAHRRPWCIRPGYICALRCGGVPSYTDNNPSVAHRLPDAHSPADPAADHIGSRVGPVVGSPRPIQGNRTRPPAPANVCMNEPCILGPVGGQWSRGDRADGCTVAKACSGNRALNSRCSKDQYSRHTTWRGGVGWSVLAS